MAVVGNDPYKGSEGGVSSSAEAIVPSGNSREPNSMVFQLWIVLL